jgi:predicted acylesterase/phospholipase RssA
VLLRPDNSSPVRCLGAQSDLNKKRVSLAPQGGGSHGAFTWGALTRVLEDDHIAIDGISGTSAGAMNGPLLVAGMMEGGPDVARRKLDRFWRWSRRRPDGAFFSRPGSIKCLVRAILTADSGAKRPVIPMHSSH